MIDDRFAFAFLEHSGISADQVIAADRGLLFCERHGFIPRYIVGDFDSAGGEDPGITGRLAEYEKRPDVTVCRYPSHKDQTDTQIAAALAAELGWRSFFVLGGTGTRLDHVLGNLQVMEQMARRGIEMVLVDPHNRIRMLAGESRLRILREKAPGGGRGVFSLVPWGGPAEGVTLTGMEYPLQNALLRTDDALGISNEIREEEATVSVRKGSLLVIEASDCPFE